MKVKKPRPNSCPDSIIKRLHFSIAPILCSIINTSFENGTFPKCLKSAYITPIFKQGDRKNVSNFRPISVLPTFSKIIPAYRRNNANSSLDFTGHIFKFAVPYKRIPSNILL